MLVHNHLPWPLTCVSLPFYCSPLRWNIRTDEVMVMQKLRFRIENAPTATESLIKKPEHIHEGQRSWTCYAASHGTKLGQGAWNPNPNDETQTSNKATQSGLRKHKKDGHPTTKRTPSFQSKPTEIPTLLKLVNGSETVSTPLRITLMNLRKSF